MKAISKNWWQILLLVEFFLVILFFSFGRCGFYVLQGLQKQNAQLDEQISAVENEIKELEKNINDWHNYPYYQEQIARTQLHMAKNNEQVYFIIQAKECQ